MNIYFCHFNSIQSPSFTISFCTCNNNFLYRWKKSACGLKHLSNLNAQLPLSYCIVRRHTFGKSRIFLLPNNITPRTFHNSMYTLLSFHIYPHSISHLLKWKTTQGCYVQHLHVPRGPESAVCLQPQACESLLELRSYSGYHSVSCSFSRCMCSIKTAFSSWSMGGIGGTVNWYPSLHLVIWSLNKKPFNLWNQTITFFHYPSMFRIKWKNVKL